jgi:hypothetical protein
MLAAPAYLETRVTAAAYKQADRIDRSTVRRVGLERTGIPTRFTAPGAASQEGVTPRRFPQRAAIAPKTPSCAENLISLLVVVGAVLESFPALLDVLTGARHRVARAQH